MPKSLTCYGFLGADAKGNFENSRRACQDISAYLMGHADMASVHNETVWKFITDHNEEE